jgi:AcrR family transcriptional regulator
MTDPRSATVMSAAGAAARTAECRISDRMVSGDRSVSVDYTHRYVYRRAVDSDGGTFLRGTARARIIETSYGLFSAMGVRAVGIDRIVAESGVSKKTLYRYFPSKDDLILAFLEERGRRWTGEWLLAEVERIAPDPQGRAIALFDVLDEWFHRPDYEGCSFIRTLHEVTGGRVHAATVRQLELVRQMLARYAAEAGAADPDDTAYQMQILMMGAMVSACRGDRDAGRRVRSVAVLLLDAAR